MYERIRINFIQYIGGASKNTIGLFQTGIFWKGTKNKLDQTNDTTQTYTYTQNLYRNGSECS